VKLLDSEVERPNGKEMLRFSEAQVWMDDSDLAIQLTGADKAGRLGEQLGRILVLGASLLSSSG